jgi:transcriptional regulator GlxA family with amidase domain
MHCEPASVVLHSGRIIGMDQRVQSVLNRLGESISNKPAVDELAETVNLSPSHLRRLFKAETGIPLNRYLKSLRLEKSKDLIEHTFLNMKQIMFAVGVKDKSQFAREFKKLTGLTPSQYAARFRLTENFKMNILSNK